MCVPGADALSYLVIPSGARSAQSRDEGRCQMIATSQRKGVRSYYVYMLLCADGSFYVGITRDPEARLWQHNAGIDEKAYTHSRRPVRMVHVSEFNDVFQAIAWEKHVKKWSHAKKRALADGDWARIHGIVTYERRQRERLKRGQ